MTRKRGKEQVASQIFACISLTRNRLIFLVQFGINQHSSIFLVFEKFTRADLSYIVLEIMRLPTQIEQLARIGKIFIRWHLAIAITSFIMIII